MSDYGVNNELLRQLYFNVRNEESKNLRSGKYDDATMRRVIIKEIDTVVKREERQDEVSQA